MPNSQEKWQVEVNGQVYEANFAELTEWIGEGALQPEDKIRRGNLRWIEARKVPGLVSFFNAKEKGLPMPVVVSTTNAETNADIPLADQSALQSAPKTFAQSVQNIQSAVPQNQGSPVAQTSNPDICQRHPDRESFYLCPTCGGGFCKGCPNAYGGVRICPACGAMCKPREEVRKQQWKQRQHGLEGSGGFGFGDFANAVAYPFKFKVSLIMGALMFMFFSLGQSAAAFGGLFLVAAAIICFMLANMLTFGILANTVDNFAQGKIGENFMPNFDDFSLWGDVVHPFFLWIGVCISSFGVFLVVLVIGVFMVINAMTAQMKSMQGQVEKLPGTPYYSGPDTVQQSKEVKELLDKVSQKNDERLKLQQENIQNRAEAAEGNVPLSSANEADTAAPPSGVQDTEATVKEANDLINRTRKAQLESTFGKTPETKEKELQQMVSGLLKLAAPLVVIGFISLIWGLIYFPAACAVAGYTRSFFATLNPLVGLDTIKRLGFDYVKILFMSFLIVLASGIVGSVLGLVFVAFDMPSVGNLPAKAIGSLFGFYLSVVFSCVLGFALYKASDRLRLYK